jgi:kynurenine formamidase
MARRIVDLSVTLEDKPMELEGHRPEIKYFGHTDPASIKTFENYFPGVPISVLPDGVAWQSERISLNSHAGTHMDAPFHYHPTTDHAVAPGGRPSPGIDAVPLDLCFQPGVKLDFRRFDAGYVVTVNDVKDELTRIGHTLKPAEIVLINTRAGQLYGRPGYFDAHIGIGREATLFLLNNGIRVVGTDGFGWDAPFGSMAERYKQTGDASIIWEGHKAGREIGYFQMEKLCNLESLPANGFQVVCFPIKIKDASAGWVRAVAIFED